MESLSLVVIAFNESRNIERCLNSAKAICSEMVVVDSGSTDNTVELAQALGARVVHQPFLGYIEQKNFAISQASGAWILSLDSDEALDDTLIQSIQKFLVHPSHQACSMNRMTNYCGHWVKHGSWYPDTKTRLFRKGYGVWTGDNPHDRYELPNGDKPLHLKGNILHYSFYSRNEHVKQMEHFSTIMAKSLFAKGKRASLLKIYLKTAARFFIDYFIKTGFLDGQTGFIIAKGNARYTYLKYWKLNQLQQGKNEE